MEPGKNFSLPNTQVVKGLTNYYHTVNNPKDNNHSPLVYKSSGINTLQNHDLNKNNGSTNSNLEHNAARLNNVHINQTGGPSNILQSRVKKNPGTHANSSTKQPISQS